MRNINTTNNYWVDFSSVNPSSDQSGLCTSAADARMAIVRAKEGIWARIPDHRLAIETSSRKHHEHLAAIKTSKVWFPYSHNCTLSALEQSSILSAKFDCPVARLNFCYCIIVNLAYESQEGRKHGRNWSVLDKCRVPSYITPTHPTPPHHVVAAKTSGRLSHALIFVYIQERNN